MDDLARNLRIRRWAAAESWGAALWRAERRRSACFPLPGRAEQRRVAEAESEELAAVQISAITCSRKLAPWPLEMENDRVQIVFFIIIINYYYYYFEFFILFPIF